MSDFVIETRGLRRNFGSHGAGNKFFDHLGVATVVEVIREKRRTEVRHRLKSVLHVQFFDFGVHLLHAGG